MAHVFTSPLSTIVGRSTPVLPIMQSMGVHNFPQAIRADGSIEFGREMPAHKPQRPAVLYPRLFGQLKSLHQSIRESDPETPAIMKSREAYTEEARRFLEERPALEQQFKEMPGIKGASITISLESARSPFEDVAVMENIHRFTIRDAARNFLTHTERMRELPFIYDVARPLIDDPDGALSQLGGLPDATFGEILGLQSEGRAAQPDFNRDAVSKAAPLVQMMAEFTRDLHYDNNHFDIPRQGLAALPLSRSIPRSNSLDIAVLMMISAFLYSRAPAPDAKAKADALFRISSYDFWLSGLASLSSTALEISTDAYELWMAQDGQIDAHLGAAAKGWHKSAKMYLRSDPWAFRIASYRAMLRLLRMVAPSDGSFERISMLAGCHEMLAGYHARRGEHLESAGYSLRSAHVRLAAWGVSHDKARPASGAISRAAEMLRKAGGHEEQAGQLQSIAGSIS